MAKDASGKSDITRIDLRIPNHLFKEIEQLAQETNQPVHHRTGKVITTPVILNLIQLGLKSYRNEDLSPQAIASKESLKEAELEKKLLEKLEVMINDKVTEAINNLSNPFSHDLNSLNTSVNEVSVTKGNVSDNQADTINNEDSIFDTVNNNSTPTLSISQTYPNKQDEGKTAKPLEDKDNSLTDISTDTKTDYTFEDTVKEIKRLKAQGVNSTKIAKMLEGKYPTARSSYKWANTQVDRILKKEKEKEETEELTPSLI